MAAAVLLGSFAAYTADQLAAIVRNRLKRIQYRPALIDGFLAQTGLSFDPNPREDQTLAFQAL
jgi:putative transposase